MGNLPEGRSRRLAGLLRSERGQTVTEWLMIAGTLTAVALFLLDIVPGALRSFVRALAYSIRTVAP